MRRARLTQFQAFIGCSSLFAALVVSAGCEPDLTTLSARHGEPLSGGSGGKGGSGSGSGSGASGGTENNGGEASMPDSCFDDKRSSDESDVDCGGTGTCRRCDLNSVCTANSDCAVGFCKTNRCTEPTCEDKIKNQDETDVDCGGGCDERCDEGKDCNESSDCESGFCGDDDKCQPYCDSGKHDGDETGVDCGGPTCGKCPSSEACDGDGDCESDLCLNKFCADPSCDDELFNGDETDLDCGGSCAPSKLCALEQTCEKASDCDSFVCTNDECVPDDPYDPSDVLDTLDDGDGIIPELEGRKGGWYKFGDGSGLQSYGAELIEGTANTRGSASPYAMRSVATGFTSWGFGVGFDLKQVSGAKTAYDATAYSGITFWARAATNVQMRVAFADAYTERTLHICDQTEAGASECDLHLGATVPLKNEWQKYTVPFTPLQPDGGSSHTELWVDQLVSIQFRFSGGADVDYWVDDIIFIPAP